MKKVFLDTNILIDAIENRRYTEEAKIILQMGRDGELSLYAAIISYINIAYILRKRPKDLLYKYLRTLSTGIEILPMDAKQFTLAMESKLKDFEDAMQYQCAKMALCDIIITNNTNDFKGTDTIRIMTSEQFLTEFDTPNH